MIESILTANSDVITCEIDIEAPLQRVFKAIADEDEVQRRSPFLSVYKMDLRVGGRWHLEFRPPKPYHGFEVIVHGGEVLELEPPRLLVYSWTANFHDDPEHKSIVRWELSRTKSGTRVKLTHSGLASEPKAAKDYAGGWPGVLEELKTYVEQAKGEKESV